MAKLIVNAPGGIQEIIEVKEGGGYFDESLVVWDERKDGPLPASDEARVGGLARNPDGTLFLDAARKKQTDDAVKAIKDTDDKKKADKQTRKQIFKALKNAVTVDDLKAVLIALVQELDLERD